MTDDEQPVMMGLGYFIRRLESMFTVWGTKQKWNHKHWFNGGMCELGTGWIPFGALVTTLRRGIFNNNSMEDTLN